jgi:hypothetical protein
VFSNLRAERLHGPAMAPHSRGIHSGPSSVEKTPRTSRTGGLDRLLD